MAKHEKMATWDRHRTKKELRNFIEARISQFDEIDDLDLY